MYQNSKNRDIDSIRIDTVYFSNGNIEQLLRINKRTGLLQGRCESFYPSGILKTVKYFYNDTAQGNSFEFYQNGKLKKYNFLFNTTYNLYNKLYDSIDGSLISEQGSPFVGYDIFEKPRDTLQIRLYLSNYGCREITMDVSSGNKKYENVALKPGHIEGEVMALGWKEIKGLPHVSLYLKTTCVDSLFHRKVYLDTIFVK